MSTFENDADRLLAVVGEGLPMTEACRRIGLSYDTARKWVTAGRADPDGKYGQFVKALDAARSLAEDDQDEDYEPGPVEREVSSLIVVRKAGWRGSHKRRAGAHVGPQRRPARADEGRLALQ